MLDSVTQAHGSNAQLTDEKGLVEHPGCYTSGNTTLSCCGRSSSILFGNCPRFMPPIYRHDGRCKLSSSLSYESKEQHGTAKANARCSNDFNREATTEARSSSGSRHRQYYWHCGIRSPTAPELMCP